MELYWKRANQQSIFNNNLKAKLFGQLCFFVSLRHILLNKISRKRYEPLGFEYSYILGKDIPSYELRAIEYQRRLDTWDFPTQGLKRHTQKYEDRMLKN